MAVRKILLGVPEIYLDGELYLTSQEISIFRKLLEIDELNYRRSIFTGIRFSGLIKDKTIYFNKDLKFKSCILHMPASRDSSGEYVRQTVCFVDCFYNEEQDYFEGKEL